MPQLPDEIQHQLLWTAPIGLAAGVAAGYVLWRQWEALHDAPERPVAFTTIDAVVAIGLFVLPPVLIEGLLRWSLVVNETGAAAHGTSMTNALLTLLRQVGGQGPLVAYILWRVLRQRGGAHAVGLLPARPVRPLSVGLIALALTLPIVFMVITIATAIGALMGYLPPEVGHPMLTEMRNSDSHLALALFLTSAIVIAPLFEEVIFRGLVQTALLNALGREARWAVIVLAASIFMLVHANVEWQALPGLFVLGVAMGWVYERTGSLWASMVMHVGFNLVNSVVALWLA